LDRIQEVLGRLQKVQGYTKCTTMGTISLFAVGFLGKRQSVRFGRLYCF